MHEPALILIVDDEPVFRDIFSTKLKAAGFAVETAENGQSALVAIKAHVPDLVLLDVMMPGMSGIEVMMTIKHEPGIDKTKVCFLTNFGEVTKELQETDRKFSQELGAIDYLKKTDDLEVIVGRVKSILAAH